MDKYFENDLSDKLTCTFVELLISTINLVRVPTLIDWSLNRLKNIGGSSPNDLSSTISSISFLAELPFFESAYSV